jgi:hypothetical protein
MANATDSPSAAVLDEERRTLIADVIAEEPNLPDADSGDPERCYFELDSVGSWLASNAASHGSK